VSEIWGSDLTEAGAPRGLALFARCGFGANDWDGPHAAFVQCTGNNWLCGIGGRTLTATGWAGGMFVKRE